MLQRSVTETRRLASGRPSVSRSSDMGGSRRGMTGGVDPDFAAIGAQLFFPNGHAALDLLDDVAAGFERLRPVRRGGDDRDAGLAGRDEPEPMPYADSPAAPALLRLRDDVTQLQLDHRFVGRVLDRRHAVLIRPVADRAQEDARATALGRRDLREQLVERDAIPGEIGRHGSSVHTLKGVLGESLPLRTVPGRAQASAWETSNGTGIVDRLTYPPAIGGNSATSSPSCTLASSFTCLRFTAVSGRSGMSRPPGNSSRTWRTTSPTVAGSGMASAASARPTSSAYRAKNRTRIVPADLSTRIAIGNI